ncbi:hypothetical protein D3C79_768530 [compost metagenome]
MMKPMRDIMRTPWVKASWLSRNLMTPPQVKMMKPARAPSTMLLVINCNPSATAMASRATQIWLKFSSTVSGSAARIFSRSYWRGLR